LLFDSIDEGFCIVEVLFDGHDRAVDYRFLEANPAFERHTGLSRVQGKSMRQIAPAHEEHWFEAYGRVALTGESVRFENHARALEERWFDVFAFRVDNPEDHHVAILFTDISARKAAEQALAASEARFRSLVELGPIGIAIAEPDGHVVLANDALLAMLGYTREELNSLNWRDRTAPEHLPLDLATIDSQRRGGPPVPFEKEYVRRDGTRVSALVVAQFLPGEGERMIAYALDITDHKKAEQALRDSEAQLRRAADALQDADRRKDDFIATLAHELRNPLAPIRSGVQILRMSAPADLKLQRTTDMMDRQIRHLVRLVDDLLDVSRITRGKIVLRRERTDLNQILRRALESSSSLFELNAQKVSVDIAPQPLLVQGDPDRLTQVFSNLLSNAAKFTPHDGSIWLSARQEGNDALIAVRDNGIGIPAERLDAVFEMFNQVHTPHGNDGLGIGLALVRQILRLHNGSVVATSAGPGRGSCFTVRLPALGSAQTADDAHVTSHASTPAHPAGADSHHRVLVVDDNRDAVESLESLLKLRGHDVAVCTSGIDAVALTPSYQPDVILMDLGMPEMDGLTAANLIRAQPRGSTIRIIALTGWGQESDRERTREAGINQHLVKPVSWEALIDAVEQSHASH